jgi:hypothetical protein
MTNVGIFDRLFGVFFSFGNSKEAIKKKKLLYIKKIISKSRYKKFYKVSSNEALPPLASFFLQTYNSVSSYGRCLAHSEKSSAFKQIIFEHFIDEEQRRLLREISPEFVEQQAATHEPEVLSDLMDENIRKLKRSFNAAWISAIDKTFNQIVLFSWFVNFDYNALLEKLESKNPKSDGNRTFKKARGSHVIENIKDFLAVAGIISAVADWRTIFSILKKIEEAIPGIDSWIQQKEIVQNVIDSEILTYIVQWATEDPEWQSKVFGSNTKFAESIINDYIADTRKALRTILSKNESENINKMERQIFGSEWVAYAQYYTENNNTDHVSRGYHGYTSTWQFNFILSFLFKFHENIKELTNVFLIRGFWVNRGFANDLSLAMQAVSESFQKLTAFDQAQSESGEDGIKLKTLLTKAAIGKRHGEQLERHFYQINDSARQLITETLNSLVHLNACLNTLRIEDEGKQRTLIRNWEELESYKKDTNAIQLDECVEKTEKLISLIQYIDSVKMSTTTD